MSHPAEHMADDEPPLELKPRPRRPFELSSGPPTPDNDAPSHVNTFPPPAAEKADSTPSRNRSFLNLTTSTLFGIYAPSGLGTDTVSPTPIGDGTQTPVDRRSFDFTRSSNTNTLPSAAFTKTSNGKITRRDTNSRPRPLVRKKTFTNFVLPTTARLTTLFITGMLYGGLISHLHDQQHLAPTAVALDRQNWAYYITWGIIGAILGEALPWADLLWAEDEDEDSITDDNTKPQRQRIRRRESWLDAVRSIGLFVGIAFAIRKLPWQSTLQLSLTLALAGPAVWYVIDRSPPAFFMSSAVAVGGTVLLLGINPNLLPGPSPMEILQGYVRSNGTNGQQQGDELVFGMFRTDSVGVAAWIASVLFVSAVCFGNLGRRLVK